MDNVIEINSHPDFHPEPEPGPAFPADPPTDKFPDIPPDPLEPPAVGGPPATEPAGPAAEPEQPKPILCSVCHAPLYRISWNFDPRNGLVLFYHDEPQCERAIGIQLLVPSPVRPQPRIVSPGGLITP